ncbi:MAG: nitroreductase family protein [Acidimicrobiia bacterium]
MDLYEALYTTRAMRRMKPDPVPADVVRCMLDAAVRAPSGSNAQNWRWLTVTDRETMKSLGTLYADAFEILQNTVYAGVEPANDQDRRILSSSSWLAEHFAEVPLVVLAFHRNDPSGASIYPAVWNLMLAARGRGVGTTLTTILGMFKSDELFALLDVPRDKGWTNAAAVTCGYPLGRWGLAARAPARDVVYSERWGSDASWEADEPWWQSG